MKTYIEVCDVIDIISVFHVFCLCVRRPTLLLDIFSLDIYKIEKKIKNNFLIYIEKLTFLHKVYKKKHSRHLLIKILGGFTHESIFIFIF